MTEKVAKTERLNFSTRSYPTFGGRGKVFDELNPPKTVTDSPYYWWFMFLRLNEGYKATCKEGEVRKCTSLHRDFGDIYKVNFKEWWREKAHFFSEPKKGYKMKIATNINDIAPFDDDEVLNLVVPLNRSQRSLKKAFSQLVLKRVEKGKRGVSVEASEAQYRLSGKWHTEALATAYKIYEIRKYNEEAGVKMAWADIAIEAKLPMSFSLKEGNKNVNSDVRKTLTILAKRHFDRAEQYIASAVTRNFPYQKIRS